MINGSLTEGDTVVLEPVAGGSAWAQVQHKLEGLYGFELVELTAEQEARY